MLNPDDVELLKPSAKPRDLQAMSVQELSDYIAVLESEIARVDVMIEKKQAHRDGLDSLFKKS